MQYGSEHDSKRAHAQEHAGEIDRLHEELAQLRDALDLRDEFIAMLGHQLRNPLAPLVMAMQLLDEQLANIEEPLSPAAVQERLRALTGELQRFVGLLDRIFEASSLDAGQLALHPERVDLAAEVEACLERHRRMLHAARCDLTCEVDHAAIGEWDRARIDEIIDCLLGNALRYGSGHPIEVRVRRDGGDAVLVVQDHGIGIAHAEQKRVFERYVRGTRGRRACGLGLGLWIVQELCHAMGGEVSLDSELGRGATFIVRLPLSRAA